MVVKRGEMRETLARVIGLLRVPLLTQPEQAPAAAEASNVIALPTLPEAPAPAAS